MFACCGISLYKKGPLALARQRPTTTNALEQRRHGKSNLRF
jgi:hypothetical protein